MATNTTGTAERIVFRQFDRTTLESLAPGLTDILPPAAAPGTATTPDPTVVELLVNPYEVSFGTAREIQKTRVLSRGRYNVQDWGPDLTVVKMRCQTGNLLPYRAFEGQQPEAATIPTGYSGPTEADITAGITAGPVGSKVEFFKGVKQLVVGNAPLVSTFDTLKVLQPNEEGYTNLLLQSPRFQNFLALFVLYHEFDANNEVLLMTFSRGIFRGYLTSFEYSITAESPWNWKFDMEFVILQGLSSFFGSTAGKLDVAKLLAARNGEQPAELIRGTDETIPLLANPVEGFPFRQQTIETAVVDIGDPTNAQTFENAVNIAFNDIGFTGFLGSIFDSPQISSESIIDDIINSIGSGTIGS